MYVGRFRGLPNVSAWARDEQPGGDSHPTSGSTWHTARIRGGRAARSTGARPAGQRRAGRGAAPGVVVSVRLTRPGAPAPRRCFLPTRAGRQRCEILRPCRAPMRNARFTSPSGRPQRSRVAGAQNRHGVHADRRALRRPPNSKASGSSPAARHQTAASATSGDHEPDE